MLLRDGFRCDVSVDRDGEMTWSYDVELSFVPYRNTAKELAGVGFRESEGEGQLNLKREEF